MTENQEKQSISNNDWNNYELLEETKKLRTAKSTLYVPKKDRYEDSKSTAIISSAPCSTAKFIGTLS